MHRIAELRLVYRQIGKQLSTLCVRVLWLPCKGRQVEPTGSL